MCNPLGHGDPKNQPPTGASTKDASTAPQEGGHRDAVILGCGRKGVTGVRHDPAGVAVKDRLDAVTVGEVPVEELVDDHAVLIEQEESGERHAVERHVLGLHDRVEHFVLADHGRVDVGQECELDTRRLNVRGQRLDIVVADGVELDALSSQFGQAVVQLDQLREARRSPHC